MNIISICSKIIEYSFYAIFFLVPLVFVSDTSELFEFNKLWITFGFTLLIAACYFTKMILQRRIWIQRTPLDLPIGLFLLSQIISTIFSLNTHVSIWGYYSRFNGGLLSMLTYIFLYYAFVSNFGERTVQVVKRLLYVSLTSATIVTLWGLPSHFGYDPTCFLIRGAFDVTCWTEAFQPRVRIFSTLGQPNWMAAYLSILLPIAIALGLQKTQNTQSSSKSDFLKVRQSDSPAYRVFRVFRTSTVLYLILAAAFYVAILFTDSRSGFIGLLSAVVVFTVLVFPTVLKKTIGKTAKQFLIALATLALIFSLYNGTPLTPPLTELIPTIRPASNMTKTQDVAPKVVGPALEVGGTESGNIRRIVWQGAVDLWKKYPLYGSGVETFGYAYYQSRPASHNLTSEWDFLYNKAHGELFNYLATTGALGLFTYLLMIGYFLFLVVPRVMPNRVGNDNNRTLIIALLAAYASIHVSNFLGFSVVIVNLYMFIIPALVFILMNMINPQHALVFPDKSRGAGSSSAGQQVIRSSAAQWVLISILLLVTCYLLILLLRFWLADKSYALGYNLGRVGQHIQANQYLHEAIELRRGEPTFWDELSVSSATLAVAYGYQKDATTAAKFVEEAVNASNDITAKYPNNVVFWKSRTRVFYTLSQLNPQYLVLALQSMQKASELAPTDAKIWYNLGVLYGQTNDIPKAVEVLEKTVQLKPDYRDAHYALGLFYNELTPPAQDKAIAVMKFILEKLNPNDDLAKQALKTWEAL